PLWSYSLSLCAILFSCPIPLAPASTLFPYTTLFRSDRHRDDDPRVAQAVADPVEQRAPRWVAHRERLEPPHHDAVGDDQPDEHRELLAQVVHVGAQHLVERDHDAGHDDELHDDPDL